MPNYSRRRSNYRKKRPAKKSSKTTQNLTRMMKTVSLRQCETKKSSIYNPNTIRLYHNLANYQSNLLQTTQGVQDPQGTTEGTLNRLGDEVLARGIKLKFFTQNSSDRPNVMYRIMVFWYNTIVDSGGGAPALDDTFFWSGTDGNGGNMNRMLDRPNTDRVKVLVDKIYTPAYQGNFSLQSGAGTANVGPYDKTNYHEYWIPLNNRKIKYNGDNSQFPRFKDIGLAVVAFDATTTSQIDGLGGYQFSTTFYYKDP